MKDSGRPIGNDEIERIAAEIDDVGFSILSDAIPPDEIESLTRTIDRLMESLDIPLGQNAFLGAKTRRIFNLLARDEVFWSVPIAAMTLPVIERVLDAECLLSSLTAIEMGAGQRRQPVHADDGSHGLPRPGPTSIVVAIWALTDFTKANGGTHVVPGSHRFGRRPGPNDAPETHQVEMSAGSVLFYSGSLWHGGGANETSSRRMAIVNNYCAGYLRQEECQLLALPRERVAAFPVRLRRLVGYGTYRGLLGHVDQESPETWVTPSADSEMIWTKFKS